MTQLLAGSSTTCRRMQPHQFSFLIRFPMHFLIINFILPEVVGKGVFSFQYKYFIHFSQVCSKLIHCLWTGIWISIHHVNRDPCLTTKLRKKGVYPVEACTLVLYAMWIFLSWFSQSSSLSLAQVVKKTLNKFITLRMVNGCSSFMRM